MEQRDLNAFEAIMQGMAENFNATLTANGINMRFEALKSFPLQEVKTAAMSIIGGRKFTTMPTVAEFLEHLGGGSCDDRAEVEAAKVWQAIGRVGGWSNVVFDDPVTQAVVHHGYGGWSKLCGDMLVDQQKWFIKEFVKMYGAYSRQRVQVFGVLPGRGAGKPVLIGNQEKALQIMNTRQDNTNFQITAVDEITQKLIAGKGA